MKAFYTMLELITKKPGRNIYHKNILVIHCLLRNYEKGKDRAQNQIAAFCMDRKGAKTNTAFFDSLSFLKLTPHLGLGNLWIRETLQSSKLSLVTHLKGKIFKSLLHKMQILLKSRKNI